MSCKHGSSTSMFCKPCRKESQATLRRMVASGEFVWGVFHWEQVGKYPIENAIGRTYKLESAAQKAADHLNLTVQSVHGYVVRMTRVAQKESA